MASTTIVIPCFNESRRLSPNAFLAFLDRNEGIHFLLVNDGSTDDTLSCLFALADAQPNRIQVLDLPQNGGKAEAVRLGMCHALQYEVAHVGFWDADLATPLDEIVRFIDILDRHPSIQLVIGTRLTLSGHVIERSPVRGILGRIFARTASLLTGIRIHDTQCGAKLFRKTDALFSVLQMPFSSKWIFDVELLVRLTSYHNRITQDWIYEQPLDRWHDVAGSRLRLRDFVAAPRELAGIYLAERRAKEIGRITTSETGSDSSVKPPRRRAA